MVPCRQCLGHTHAHKPCMLLAMRAIQYRSHARPGSSYSPVHRMDQAKIKRWRCLMSHRCLSIQMPMCKGHAVAYYAIFWPCGILGLDKVHCPPVKDRQIACCSSIPKRDSITRIPEAKEKRPTARPNSCLSFRNSYREPAAMAIP